LDAFGDKQPSDKHFPAVGAFSLKFSIALAAKLMIGSKKLGGAKMVRTSSITMPSMVGIVGCIRKSDFLFVCHALELQSL